MTDAESNVATVGQLGAPRTAAATGKAVDVETVSDAQEWQLWNKDVIPFVRDLLFVLAIFAYVIGFAHHAAKLSAFGVDTQLADQPLDSLFNWAAESIQGGWPGFLAILTLVAGLLFFAGYLKDRLKCDERCRPIVYGVATISVVLGLVLTYAWSSHEGLCSAARFANGLEPKTSQTMFTKSSALISALSVNSHAPPPVYVLGETNDMYQLLVTQANPDGAGTPMLSIAIPRTSVQQIEFRTFGKAAGTVASGGPGLPAGIPAPSAEQTGADTVNAATTGAAPSISSCWWIDRVAGA